MIDLLMPTIAQGLLWAIMALGVYITYRVLDIADLTVEGSFPLGAAVAASLLAGGYSPWLAFGAAMLAGMLAGVATGLLHTKLKIPALLAGILTMIALYSVNLRVMGKANLSLLRVDTVFSIMRDIGGFSNAQAVLCVGIVSSLLIGGLIYWFFGTEIGAAIRATGFNPQMIRAQGVDTNFTIILGLLISNALLIEPDLLQISFPAPTHRIVQQHCSAIGQYQQRTSLSQTNRLSSPFTRFTSLIQLPLQHSRSSQ